jgi:V-type H+-transporting ATPase subunit G
MQVAPGDDGIQKLLRAEQSAQAIIQSARQEKIAKIKQAQREAEKEVESYKSQRDDAYKSMMEQGRGDAAGRQAQLEKETAQAIKDLEKNVGSKKDVVKSIVKWVTSV